MAVATLQTNTAVNKAAYGGVLVMLTLLHTATPHHVGGILSATVPHRVKGLVNLVLLPCVCMLIFNTQSPKVISSLVHYLRST